MSEERLEVSAGDALRSLVRGTTIQQEARDRVKTDQEIAEMTRDMPGWLVTLIWLLFPSLIFGSLGLFAVVPWIIERPAEMSPWLALFFIGWGGLMGLMSLGIVAGSLLGKPQFASALGGLAMTAVFATYVVAGILGLSA